MNLVVQMSCHQDLVKKIISCLSFYHSSMKYGRKYEWWNSVDCLEAKVLILLSTPFYALICQKFWTSSEVWHECVSGNFTSPLLAKIMNIIFNLFAGKCFGLCQSICLFSVFALAQWNLSWMCIWVFCGYLKACIMIFFEWEGIAIAGDICCPFLSSLSVQFK